MANPISTAADAKGRSMNLVHPVIGQVRDRSTRITKDRRDPLRQ